MNNLAIAYSGGLDSLIMYNYAIAKGYDPICYHLDLGQPYGNKERNVFEEASSEHLEYIPKVEVIKAKEIFPLVEKRLSNQIIPSRNVLLAVIGSMLAPRVWLGILDGEQLGKEHDKSDKFLEETSNLLSFTNEFFQSSTVIEAPFRNMSKSETIRWALEYGIPKELLFKTSSCYDPVIEKCGKCLTCQKRAAAFLAAGITEPGYASDPFESDYHKELLIEIPKAIKNQDFSRFTEKRCMEFISILPVEIE